MSSLSCACPIMFCSSLMFSNRLRDAIEPYMRVKLCNHDQVMECIPVIHHLELQKVKEAIKGMKVAVIFDGASYHGELIVMVLRYWDEKKMAVKEIVARAVHQPQSVTADELQTLLVDTIGQLGLASNDVHCMICDRHSVNMAALDDLSHTWKKGHTLICLCHTLGMPLSTRCQCFWCYDNSLRIDFFAMLWTSSASVGKQFDLPASEEFMTHWHVVTSKSEKAANLWYKKHGRSIPSGQGDKRWFAEIDERAMMVENWPAIPEFLDLLEKEKVAPASVKVGKFDEFLFMVLIDCVFACSCYVAVDENNLSQSGSATGTIRRIVCVC